MLSCGAFFITLCGYLATTVIAVDPAAIYNGSYSGTDAPILLRIGNGGAGQSGLVQALADAFINFSASKGSKPFKIAWYKSDTTVTINYLKAGTVDVGITYSEIAETSAINAGIATSPSYYAFRDHFILVGPPSNPANIDNTTNIETIFADLYNAAESLIATDPPVRFLSRYDKSATNLKESALWIGLGQIPWATAYSTWYHQYIAFPIQALTAAILLDEYTITDRGTYLSIAETLQKRATIYKASSDDADDPLLNPAHLLVGTKAANPSVANAFARWLVSADGQKVIVGFEKNGTQLYSPAPDTKSFLAQTARERLGRLRNRKFGDWAGAEQGPVEL